MFKFKKKSLRTPISVRSLVCHENENNLCSIDVELNDGKTYKLIVDHESNSYNDWIRQTAGFDNPARLAYELSKPGDVAVDLGANIGAWSLPLAAKGCQILAFEILPQNVNSLRAAANQNHFGDNLQIEHCAIWNRSEDLFFGGHSAWGHITQTGNAIRSISLDDFIAERSWWKHVDLIKLDVEGAELKAFEGMSSILDNLYPDLIFEANVLTAGQYGHSIYDLFALLRARDYSLYRIYGRHLVPFDGKSVQEILVCDYYATQKRAIDRTSFLPVVDSDEVRETIVATASASWLHRHYIVSKFAQFDDALKTPELSSIVATWAQEPTENGELLYIIERGSKPASSFTF